MLTSRQHFFFKSPQINFNNKNNISESSQNAKKHCYADVHKMQRTFLSKYSQNAKKTFLCQLPMLTNCLSNCSAGRGLAKRPNWTNGIWHSRFQNFQFTLNTIFVITFGQYNWLMKDMWSDYCCRWLFFLSRRHDAIVSRKPPWQSLILLKFLCGLWGENKGS